jgi:hypothetical protein
LRHLLPLHRLHARKRLGRLPPQHACPTNKEREITHEEASATGSAPSFRRPSSWTHSPSSPSASQPTASSSCSQRPRPHSSFPCSSYPPPRRDPSARHRRPPRQERPCSSPSCSPRQQPFLPLQQSRSTGRRRREAWLSTWDRLWVSMREGGKREEERRGIVGRIDA